MVLTASLAQEGVSMNAIISIAICVYGLHDSGVVVAVIVYGGAIEEHSKGMPHARK